MTMVTDPQLAPRGVLFAIDGEGRDLTDPYTHDTGAGWSWLHLAQTNPEASAWVVEQSGIPIDEDTPMARVSDLSPLCERAVNLHGYLGPMLDAATRRAPADKMDLIANDTTIIGR